MRSIVAQFMPGLDGHDLPRVCHQRHGSGGRVAEVIACQVAFSEV